MERVINKDWTGGKMPEVEFETVDVLGNKDRGGYGSTGTK